jgi:hypothetical protein
VRRFKSVVGASVIVWEPETEFGSVARKVSAPTAKSITTTSFRVFIYIPPSIGPWGTQSKKGLFFEAGLISEERYFREADIQRPGEQER